MDRTTVTAALKPLQRRSLVVLDVSEGDLRGRSVSMTSEGTGLLRRAVPLWQEAQKQIAELVGGDKSAMAIRHKLAATH